MKTIKEQFPEFLEALFMTLYKGFLIPFVLCTVGSSSVGQETFLLSSVAVVFCFL